jgi:hypothetical protein
MLLDFGHAREKGINLLRKASITHTQLFQPFNAAVNYRNLACDVSKATIKCGTAFPRARTAPSFPS